LPNWSILRNYKEIWNFTKINITRGVYLTRGGSVPRPLSSGPRGWLASQTPWPASPTLQPLTGWLHSDTLQEAIEGNPRVKVSRGETPWPAGHVARLALHHLECYRLNHVGNPSLDPYKYPPTCGNQSNTHNFWFSTCKRFGLVVAQVKPCRELRVKSSFRSSSRSSLRDR
jgi:hypothetical protein